MKYSYTVYVHTTYFAMFRADCANLEEVRQYVDDWKDEADHYDFYLNNEHGSRRILNPLKQSARTTFYVNCMLHKVPGH